MPPEEIVMLCEWLKRLETKIDHLTGCIYIAPTRLECEEHRKGVWLAIDGLRRLVWIGVGIAIASSVLVPLLLKFG